MTDTGYLDRLFVHKDWQNQRIAKLLVQEFESNCSSNIFTTCFYITAQPFFQSQGYKVKEDNEVLLRGNFLKNYFMEKSQF